MNFLFFFGAGSSHTQHTAGDALMALVIMKVGGFLFVVAGKSQHGGFSRYLNNALTKTKFSPKDKTSKWVTEIMF